MSELPAWHNETGDHNNEHSSEHGNEHDYSTVTIIALGVTLGFVMWVFTLCVMILMYRFCTYKGKNNLAPRAVVCAGPSVLQANRPPRMECILEVKEPDPDPAPRYSLASGLPTYESAVKNQPFDANNIYI